MMIFWILLALLLLFATLVCYSALVVASRADEWESVKLCCNCIEWETCPCGKQGYKNGSSQGLSIGECKDYKPKERRKDEQILHRHNRHTDTE